jgi:hypothetical protein
MKKEIETETLRIAIRINERFLALVPKGSDKDTERKVQADKARLSSLEATS